MKLLNVLKKNAVLILFILAVLGLVLYMNYKPEGFQQNSVAPPPSENSPKTIPFMKPSLG